MAKLRKQKHKHLKTSGRLRYAPPPVDAMVRGAVAGLSPRERAHGREGLDCHTCRKALHVALDVMFNDVRKLLK